MKEDTSSSRGCGKEEESQRESTTHGLVRCGKLVEKVVDKLLKEEQARKIIKFPIDNSRP